MCLLVQSGTSEIGSTGWLVKWVLHCICRGVCNTFLHMPTGHYSVCHRSAQYLVFTISSKSLGQLLFGRAAIRGIPSSVTILRIVTEDGTPLVAALPNNKVGTLTQRFTWNSLYDLNPRPLIYKNKIYIYIQWTRWTGKRGKFLNMTFNYFHHFDKVKHTPYMYI